LRKLLKGSGPPEHTVAETVKITGNWKALFLGPNTKIRREL